MSVLQEARKSGPEGREENMNTILAKGLAKGKKLFGKAALATVALGGFLAFFGAGTASARPVVYVHVRPHAVFVGPEFYVPRPVYRPYYRPYYAAPVVPYAPPVYAPPIAYPAPVVYAAPRVYAAPPVYAYAGPAWRDGWGHRHHFRGRW